MAELSAFASELERAGLLVTRKDEQGRDAYQLTTDGRGVNRMLAMVDGRDADGVLDALLATPRMRIGSAGDLPAVEAPKVRWRGRSRSPGP